MRRGALTAVLHVLAAVGCQSPTGVSVFINILCWKVELPYFMLGLADGQVNTQEFYSP